MSEETGSPIREYAIAAWNARAPDPDRAALLEAVKGMRGALCESVNALKRLRASLEGGSGTIKMESNIAASLEFGAACFDGHKAIQSGDKALALWPAEKKCAATASLTCEKEGCPEHDNPSGCLGAGYTEKKP